MNDLIMKLVKESIWIQVQKDFHEFTIKHCETLNKKEQIVFANLINSGDEYSHAILENLWREFEVEGCSEKRLKELFDIELKKLTEGVSI
jgi:hypothetical protein